MSSTSCSLPQVSSDANKKNKKRRKRNWAEINERLVNRYDFTLFLEFLDDWQSDLSRLNSQREGAGCPYQYPDSLFIFARIIQYLYGVPYRGVEGFLRGVVKLRDYPNAPDYTTVYRRCKRLSLDEALSEYIPMPDKPLVIAIDSTGFKIDNYSEWMRHKWGSNAKERRGWIKIHAVVDAKTHMAIQIEVTDESISDQHEFIPLVESCLNSGYKIERALADGIYDTREIHSFLSSHGIKPGIPPRKNASTRSRGCPSRAEEVRYIRDYGKKLWKNTRQYNKRVSVERLFGAFKSLFGDDVTARKWANIVREFNDKFALYAFLLSGASI